MKKTNLTLSTTEVADKLQVTRAAVTLWCRQKLFPGAFVEETPRGPIWHIPREDMKTFKPPTPGRPLGTKKKQFPEHARKKSKASSGR
jgi:hypothetical protein